MGMVDSTSRSLPTSVPRESSSCSTWEGSLPSPTSGEEGKKHSHMCETASVAVQEVPSVLTVTSTSCRECHGSA